jgi:hypothetical protein
MKDISALAEDLGVQLNLELVNRFENYLVSDPIVVFENVERNQQGFAAGSGNCFRS